LVSSIESSDHWVTGDYETAILPNLGHFPQEEDPDAFNAALIPWLRRVTA
jgi:pimeloyl-ACP methyl ester carboxylesterase